ncbi:MAG TPA: hypothetical protein VFN57_04545 [Thermomicrobiaceae bacterium]|nr:hypothetical protein [Thermomicrobiaceae bacterium]
MWLLRVLRVGAVLTPLLPPWLAYTLCRIVAVLFFLGNYRTRRQVIDNLRHVEPDASRARRYRDAMRVFMTVVTNYYDMVRLWTVDQDRVLDLFQVEGWDHLTGALSHGEGVIVLSAHVGNFNVVASYPAAAAGFHTAVIAERVEPPPLFDYMAGLRSGIGIDVIPPGSEAIRPLMRLLRHNGILLLAGDRDVVGHGAMTEFFGEPAALPVGPVLLAMRTGAMLVPAYTLRRRRQRSIVHILPPIDLVRTGDWEEDLQQNHRLMARTLERMIAPDPGQWAVLQQIWPPASQYFGDRGEGLGGIPPTIHAKRPGYLRRAGRRLTARVRPGSSDRGRRSGSGTPDRRESAAAAPPSPSRR